MSDEQLSLDSGRPAVPMSVQLTGRQELALAFIRETGTVSSDELGARLHEDRRARGGRGHDRDERCEWCGGEGAAMGARLRELGLIRRRNGPEGGWYDPESPEASSPAGAGELPEGF